MENSYAFKGSQFEKRRDQKTHTVADIHRLFDSELHLQRKEHSSFNPSSQASHTAKCEGDETCEIQLRFQSTSLQNKSGPF